MLNFNLKKCNTIFWMNVINEMWFKSALSGVLYGSCPWPFHAMSCTDLSFHYNGAIIIVADRNSNRLAFGQSAFSHRLSCLWLSEQKCVQINSPQLFSLHSRRYQLGLSKPATSLLAWLQPTDEQTLKSLQSPKAAIALRKPQYRAMSAISSDAHDFNSPYPTSHLTFR